tara:strand:- start:503 stop:1354 length:852 start_codon:yes stop_codon:yes gene_type:complete
MSEIKTNKISSLASNNNITLEPDGTGDIVASAKVGVGVAPNATFGSLLYAQGTPAANKPIISGYSQGNSNNAGIALFNDAGNRGIWTTGSTMRFTRTYEGNSTADVTIDASGSLLIGRTNTDSNTGGHFITGDYAFFEKDGAPLFVNRFGSNGTAVQFRRQNSNVGDIYVTTSGTAYNTSSDYRLKENVTYDWDATTRLKQLKPARFNFIADPDTTVDGFLAHECSAVPEAVTGTKDAVDADGNPVHQGIDQAKIVPLLTKALTESVEKIEQLEARITALEAE